MASTLMSVIFLYCILDSLYVFDRLSVSLVVHSTVELAQTRIFADEQTASAMSACWVYFRSSCIVSFTLALLDSNMEIRYVHIAKVVSLS